MVSGEVRVARGNGEPDWLVVVDARSLLALPLDAPGSPARRAAEATAAALTGSTLPPTELEELIARIRLGTTGVDAFALVWGPAGGGRLTAVVRGAASVELRTTDGPRRLDSHGIRPWHLAEFRDVITIRIGSVTGDDVSWADVPGERRPEAFSVSGVEWVAPGHRAGSERDALGQGDAPAAPAPGVPAPPADSARDAAHFRVRGGEPREVARVVLIGRRPTPPRIARERVELVRIDAATAAVSATHLELRREGRRLVATDLRSTNGTVVRTASGTRRMRAGESIVVAPGAVLELGGDTIVEILPPPQDQAYPDRQVPA